MKKIPLQQRKKKKKNTSLKNSNELKKEKKITLRICTFNLLGYQFRFLEGAR